MKSRADRGEEKRDKRDNKREDSSRGTAKIRKRSEEGKWEWSGSEEK